MHPFPLFQPTHRDPTSPPSLILLMRPRVVRALTKKKAAITLFSSMEGKMPVDTTNEPDIIIGEEELIALATEAGKAVVDSDDCCDCVV